MDNSLKKKRKARWARVNRVRKCLKGTSRKPRLSVSKTNCHFYAQLIDDELGTTIAGKGTLSKENKGGPAAKKSKEAVKLIGAQIAQIAKEKNIEVVVFDRGRYKFHGLVAEFANAAREAGLQF